MTARYGAMRDLVDRAFSYLNLAKEFGGPVLEDRLRHWSCFCCRSQREGIEIHGVDNSRADDRYP